jgi:hypothetical protein
MTSADRPSCFQTIRICSLTLSGAMPDRHAAVGVMLRSRTSITLGQPKPDATCVTVLDRQMTFDAVPQQMTAGSRDVPGGHAVVGADHRASRLELSSMWTGQKGQV